MSRASLQKDVFSQSLSSECSLNTRFVSASAMSSGDEGRWRLGSIGSKLSSGGGSNGMLWTITLTMSSTASARLVWK
jgi:hypothetical protein